MIESQLRAVNLLAMVVAEVEVVVKVAAPTLALCVAYMRECHNCVGPRAQMKSVAPVAVAYAMTVAMAVTAKMVMTLVDKVVMTAAVVVAAVEAMTKVNKIARAKAVIADALTMIIHA